MKTLAVIGSGISGLGSAWFLNHEYDITVFEAADYVGGHTHTVTVDDGERRAPVDTGFMVFNHFTYPNLTRLFDVLGVPTKPTDMSFSVQHRARNLEYCGSSLNHLFAQRRNLLRPSFYRMLAQIDRFNREAKAALEDPATSRLSLDEYVTARGYGKDFFDLYLVPMSSAVWSTPPEKMRRFPAATLLRFFHNHGFLGLHTQHPWQTVEGGAAVYVEKLTAAFREKIRLNTPVQQIRRLPNGQVEVATPHDCTVFDKVVLACHAPQSLRILGANATARERTRLSPFRYQPNQVTLHTDAGVMPRTKLAWSSWNYRLEMPADTKASPTESDVSTHYWMNRLQGVSKRKNFFVSVNGAETIDASQKLDVFEEEHPLFDRAAVAAQSEIEALNRAAAGTTETYFAGAWQRYGFHEDGLLSAINVAHAILGRDPWLDLVKGGGS